MSFSSTFSHQHLKIYRNIPFDLCQAEIFLGSQQVTQKHQKGDAVRHGHALGLTLFVNQQKPSHLNCYGTHPLSRNYSDFEVTKFHTISCIARLANFSGKSFGLGTSTDLPGMCRVRVRKKIMGFHTRSYWGAVISTVSSAKMYLKLIIS